MTMLTLSALISLVIAVPIIEGFIDTRKQRTVDRRYLAAFVGFTAATVALSAIIFGVIADIIWVRPPESAYYHPVERGFVAIMSLVALLSTGVAFFAGLCSRGSWRITLVLFPPAMAVIWLLAALSNFGA